MPRILVIDDDTTYRDRLVRAFNARGHEVRAAADGESAVRLLKEFVPERVVLDLKMPGQGGLQTLCQLLRELPALKVIILTGYASIATALEAVRNGAFDYLTKPADADQILAAFERPGSSISTTKISPEIPTLDRVEWEHIHRVLGECGGNISEAARRLGIHRRSLQRKLDKFAPGR